MRSNNNFLIKIVFIVLTIISFFAGFFFRENSAGGGEADFYSHTWPVIQSFKKDFLYTIEHYGTFNEGSYPLFHIINAYINPFSNNEINFQFSITIISFFIFIIFAFTLKKNFSNISFVDIFFTSSVLLILPFFRTSAFWGLTENFGWLFLILSIYFFLKFKDKVDKVPTNKDLLNVVFFCFISACGIYSRQTLVFFPIFYLLYLIFNNVNKKVFLTSIISYAIFSIPGFFLLFTWGGLYDVNEVLPYMHDAFSYKHVLKNIPFITSFVAFYLLPILFIELINEGSRNFFNKYLKSFFVIFILYLILAQFDLLKYLGEYSLSGGVVLKINHLIQPQNYYLLLMFSALGLSILLRIIKEDVKNNLIILLPSLIIYCFAALLYQEYVEPLIIIIFFLIVKTELHKIFFKKIFISNVILILYFSVYLTGSIYYKHFLFYPNTKWHIYLEYNEQ